MSYKLTNYTIYDMYSITYSNVNQNLYYDEELQDYVVFPNIKRTNTYYNYPDIKSAISITESLQHRPDNLVYPFAPQFLYWTILQHNNVIDPFRMEITREIEIIDWRAIVSRNQT